MKNNQLNKMGLLVCAVVFSITASVQAADLAKASGTVAGVAVKVAEANTQLAEAASGGDLAAIAEAQKRANGVDAAMSDAVEAYTALEGGDESASEALNEALQQATDALNGVISEESKQSKHAKWKKGQENTGGGPGHAYDPPNIYDVPWETAGLRSFYQGLFGNLWGSSSFGGGRDRDATPE
jgi:hypothetical protein